MKNNYRHDQENRLSQELELDNETEQELRQLFAPLGRRHAAPELNSRLRETMRETHKLIRREEHRNILKRWFTRRVAVPLPLVAAAVALIAGLGSWVTVLELDLGGGAAAAARPAGFGINGMKLAPVGAAAVVFHDLPGATSNSLSLTSNTVSKH